MSFRVTSIQSDNAAFTCRLITDYLGEQLALATEFVYNLPWQEREQLLDIGNIQLGWICGLPYVWKADQPQPQVELVAAPVMELPRYQQRPIYFSDVIVQRDSPYHCFADLRGVSWAYNEPHSQSGYNLTRYHLARLGEKQGYFGQVLEAGSHLQAIEWVLAGDVTASGIDSTVLELELAARPHLKTELRVIETLGPSPMPPWVVHTTIAPDLREAIRQVFYHMHETVQGRAILAQSQMLKFAAVEDSDYDIIRHMECLAAEVVWVKAA